MTHEGLADLLFAAHAIGIISSSVNDDEKLARLDLKILKRENLTDEELALLLMIAKRTASMERVQLMIKMKECVCDMHRLKSSLNAPERVQQQPEP